MARYLVVALLLVALVCVMQATAHPAQETSTQQSIEDALKSAGDSISKAFQDAKPKIDELLAKGQEFFEGVGKKISEEAGKMIPKSDEKAAA